LTAVWVPDAAHEALRDLVRARLAAKRDQLRARHRLGKFLLRHGRRAPEGTTAWSRKHLAWVKRQCFEQAAQQATLIDYLHEVEHEAERIVRLERSIDTAIETLAISKAGSAHLRRIVVGWHTAKENPRGFLCDRPSGQTRDLSPRQLPTNHDHDGESWHSIHEYQSDQPAEKK
jgi:hypothetical protein